MNGVHDMGGMQGLGRIEYEENEPPFHAPWEGRVHGLNRAMGAWRKWNLDAWRHDIELLPPADYLRMSYYEKWLTTLEQRVVHYGLVTEEELQSGQPSAATKTVPALTPEMARLADRGIPSSVDPSIPPKFHLGDRVRALNIHPTGHTRLPRYVRGKSGVIDRDHGVYAFPDTNSKYEGEKRQHVYSVRFAAQELWGSRAFQNDSVYVDLWDDYLEHI